MACLYNGHKHECLYNISILLTALCSLGIPFQETPEFREVNCQRLKWSNSFASFVLFIQIRK
jgi:hypothetical protein